MARPRGSKNKATLRKDAATKTTAARAKIFGTDMPDVKVSLDCLGVLEEAMRHFYLKAVIEKLPASLRTGPRSIAR